MLYLYTDVDLYLLHIEIALLNSGTRKLFSMRSKDNFYSVVKGCWYAMGVSLTCSFGALT